MLVESVLAMPLSTVTVSCGSAVSATTGFDAVVGAWAGIGCGFAGAEVVRATGVVGGALSGAGLAGAEAVTASGTCASPPTCDLGATASAGGALSAAGAGADAAGAASGDVTTGIADVGVGSSTGR